MRITHSRRVLVSAAILAIVAGLAACGTSDENDGDGAIAVAATDDKCDVKRTKAEAGTVTFDVKNNGQKTTEFYVYKGDRVMGEVENIGPGLHRKLIVELPAGSYETACKPGMRGDGIRGQFTVTGKAIKSDAKLAKATESYQSYVKLQTQELVAKTQQFVDAVKGGRIDEAKALFPVSRTYWERIEPVAEIFGDLDPAIDGREADLEHGQEFTGYHRIEKALWVENDTSQMGPVADKLMADINEIVKLANETELTPLQLANGSKELLDEIAAPNGKISGEEDIFSGTDVWDMAANLAGSKEAINSLRSVLEERDKKLLRTVDERFKAVEDLLAKHQKGDGYKFYSELSQDELRELAAAVAALSEPVSEVAAVIAQK